MDNALTMDFLIDGEPKRFKEININETGENTPKLTMDYVLSRIDAITNNTAHIDKAIKTIQEILNPDHSSGVKAEAISQVVRSREETNQKLIQLFEKMYDDLKPKQPPEPSEEVLKMQQLTEMLKDFPPEISADIIKKSVQQMFVKPATAVVM